jgi:peptidyl-prolyl cis-trans isomerase SurA
VVSKIKAQAIQNQSNPILKIDGIIAKVDNYILLKSEFDVAYLQSLAMGMQTSEDLKCKVFENLLISKLMLAKAEIDSVLVEDRLVEDQLNRRMEFFINQIGSEKKLEEFYNKSIDQLKNDLRRQVKEQMIVQKMEEKILAKVKVTPKEVKNFFESLNQDSLPLFSAEVEVAQLVKKAGVSKAQKELAKQKLEQIRQRIMNGEDFASLAKQFSEDYASARAGGELGFFNRGELVPEYEAAAFKLKPGEISSVIESPFGFHLIQLIERRGNQYNTRHILIKAGSSEIDLESTREFLDSLRNEILKESISFTKAAKLFSDDKLTKNNGGFFVDEETGSTRVPVDKIDPGIFFIIDTMKVGTISRPLPYRMEDGSQAMRLIWYKSRIPPHYANLKDDYQKIAKAAVESKKEEELEKWFKKAKNEVFMEIYEPFHKCQILEID